MNRICCRTATARGKAEQADIASMHAQEDGQAAEQSSKQYSNGVQGEKPIKKSQPTKEEPPKRM